MRPRIACNPAPVTFGLAILLVFILMACHPADPAPWMLVTPATQDVTETVVADDACDRLVALARLRAAVPYDHSVLYFTGRPEPEGDVVYSLTLWYVDQAIPLQGVDGDVRTTVTDAVNRAAPFLDTLFVADACPVELYDMLLLGVVDSAFNSWYLGNVLVADVVAGASADVLLASTEMLLPESWPAAFGDLPSGNCTWAEATQGMEACTQENGGYLLALTE